MWPITKPFPWQLRESKGAETGGRRERNRSSLPFLQPFVNQPSNPMTGVWEGHFEIHKKTKKS